jgi:hypothetical protein
MTQGFKNKRLHDGETFYCPNGHPQIYTNNDAKRTKNLEAALKTETENSKWWREHAQSTARSLSATRGQITKIKNRISKGVCPCCNRQFEDLHSHMQEKHPNYSGTEQQ